MVWHFFLEPIERDLALVGLIMSSIALSKKHAYVRQNVSSCTHLAAKPGSLPQFLSLMAQKEKGEVL